MAAVLVRAVFSHRGFFGKSARRGIVERAGDSGGLAAAHMDDRACDVDARRSALSGCRRMKRYLEIYAIMFRNSLIREMSFKANFVLWMFVELLWFVGQIVFIEVLFLYVDRIGDWSKWQVVLLVGTHQLIAQLYQAFFYVNVANVPELVRTGKMDL